MNLQYLFQYKKYLADSMKKTNKDSTVVLGEDQTSPTSCLI